jgi:dTDP-4-dehydrorhamnose reductase
MLGHKIIQTFVDKGQDVQATLRGSISDFPLNKIDFLKGIQVHEGVDAMNLPALEKLLSDLRPAAVINCIGVIKQRDEAKAAVPSIMINSLLPQVLAEWSQRWGGRVVHFSTDCVFNGQKGHYKLSDPSDAEDLYGKSKFLGEVARENALTIRTSIIGRELTHFSSLVEWFLSQQGKTVNGFTRAIYAGMTTQTMADLVLKIVTEHPEVHGLMQAASELINKYELLLLMRDAFGLDIEVKPQDEFFCDRGMISSEHLKRIGFQVPDWPAQITRMAQDPTPYHEWR